jgi:hypothetical protein
MGKSYRSAKTGRFVKKSTAKRHPSTTLSETNKGGGGGKAVKVHRSAKTGRFVKASTAARHPDTTVTETVNH